MNVFRTSIFTVDKSATKNLYYQDTYENRGKQYKMFYMNRDGFTLLAMGFTGKEALKFKLKYIEQFNLMEEQLKNNIQLASYMIDDPIKRAEKWIEEQKEKQLLQTENLMLTQQVMEYEPKVTYYDKILQSTGLLNITQIAKDYGLTGQQLNAILKDEKVQFKQNGQWLLYAKHADKGYTKSTTYVCDNGQSKLNTKWTQKGRLHIHGILLSRGIEALEDKEAN